MAVVTVVTEDPNLAGNDVIGPLEQAASVSTALLPASTIEVLIATRFLLFFVEHR